MYEVKLKWIQMRGFGSDQRVYLERRKFFRKLLRIFRCRDLNSVFYILHDFNTYLN